MEYNLNMDQNTFPNLIVKDNNFTYENSYFSSLDVNKGKFFVVKSKTPNTSFAKLNPFWIKKGFDAITCEIERVSKFKDESVLVLTKNEKGSSSLMKANKFSNLMDIEVVLHPTLNNTQGIIYCPDLNSLDSEEILVELRSQGVTNVHQMTKLINHVKKAIGLYIITFEARKLPQYIKIGFTTVKVRVYIPNPMRCIRCQKFGHTKAKCSSDEFCTNCSILLPHDSCNGVKCRNCEGDHPSSDRRCKVYLKEKEIIQIKTLENISFGEARR